LKNDDIFAAYEAADWLEFYCQPIYIYIVFSELRYYEGNGKWMVDDEDVKWIQEGNLETINYFEELSNDIIQKNKITKLHLQKLKDYGLSVV
jgi:hypothetical protein